MLCGLAEYENRKEERGHLSFIHIMGLSAFRDNEKAGKVVRGNLVLCTPQGVGIWCVRLDEIEHVVTFIGYDASFRGSQRMDSRG